MAGALRTCARKKTFQTYAAAKQWGAHLNLNPYTCPWCDKFHLTRKEGDQNVKDVPGGVGQHYTNCWAQLHSKKASTILNGLTMFKEIAPHIEEAQKKEILNHIIVTRDRVTSLSGGHKVKRRLVKKINSISEFHS